MSTTSSLLRFTSRGLPVETRVELDESDRYVVLYCEGTEVGRRRLNKQTCCRSDSPCIGWIAIAREHIEQFKLPPVVHISICFDEHEFVRNKDA